jgi:hypothetical protein
MPTVTKVNGTSYGVVHVDVASNTPGDQSAAVLHAVTGRKPTFVAIVVKNGSAETVDISNEFDSGEAIEAILKVVTADSSIIAYQVEAAGGQISIMVEGPHAGSTYGASANLSFAADLEDRIQALGSSVGANTIDVSGSTVTNVGMKLALS